VSAFNEGSRVKILALLHLTRLGYEYLPLKVASRIFSRFNVSANENNQLSHLRGWLLPLLMNGQVKVT
jgi:hypothetical protein